VSKDSFTPGPDPARHGTAGTTQHVAAFTQVPYGAVRRRIRCERVL